jgi:hypothetical protein
VRKLSVAVLAFTLVLAGSWTALALYRWEWTRALWMTMVFVVAEVALVGVLVMHRLRDLEEQMEDSRDTAVLRRLADARPATDRFDWLREETNRTNVFVTMLLGGGVLVSGVLWAIDKVAGRSVATSRERKLAGELRAMAFPASGFVPPDSVLFAADLDRDERDDLALLLLGRTEVPR